MRLPLYPACLVTPAYFQEVDVQFLQKCNMYAEVATRNMAGLSGGCVKVDNV